MNSVGSSSKVSSNFDQNEVDSLPSVPGRGDDNIMSYGGHNTPASTISSSEAALPEIPTYRPPNKWATPVMKADLQSGKSLVAEKEHVPVNCKRLFESEQKCKMNNLNEAQRQLLYKYYDDLRSRNQMYSMGVLDFYHKIGNFSGKDKENMKSLLKNADMDNYISWSMEDRTKKLGGLLDCVDTPEFKDFVKKEDQKKSAQRVTTEQSSESEEEKAENVSHTTHTNDEAGRKNIERKQITMEMRDVLEVLDNQLEGSGFTGLHFYLL